MAGKSIKLFQLNQKYCQALGMELPKSNENHCTLMYWIFVISQTVFGTALFAFLVYDAESMGEYGMTLIALIIIMAILVIYFTTILQMNEILDFIEQCEILIGKSKYAKMLWQRTLFFLFSNLT